MCEIIIVLVIVIALIYFLGKYKKSPVEGFANKWRPGSKYTMSIYPEQKPYYAYEVKLIYRPSCCKHHLELLFENIAKQMLADGTAASSNIKFTKEMADKKLPANLYGGFPKIIKIRRNGQVLEYLGATNYGELKDWILNEGLLF